MNCPKCGNPAEPNMKFCKKCGTPLQMQQPIPQQNPSVVNQQPQKPTQQADAQPAKKSKKKSGKKNNLALKIIAVILVIAVLASGGLLLADNLMHKNEIKADEYITDFPVLKQKTDFLVYNAERFPSSNYKIRVERLRNSGILKSEAFRQVETIIDDKSTEPVYSIDFKEDGDYRIILEDISAVRTQPATSTTTTQSSENTTTENKETANTIIIDVKVDNESEEAIDKVDINSKPGDKPIEIPTEPSKPDYTGVSEEELDELEKMLGEIMPYDIMHFDTDTATTKSVMDYIITVRGANGYDYFFKDNPSTNEMVEINGIPYNCFVLSESSVKWICENIFNITYTDEYVDGQATILQNGKVYRMTGNFGPQVLVYSYSVSDYAQVEENYEIIVDVYGSGWYDKTQETVTDLHLGKLKITADLQPIDGGKYWSLYKIEEYTGQTQKNVPSDAVEFNGHYYKMYDSSMSWQEAKAECESSGGHLVTITSQQEQDFVQSLIENGQKNQYWLGLDSYEGWITGEELAYTNWDAIEPNHCSRSDGQVERYVHILRIANPQIGNSMPYAWNDIYYDNTYPGEEDNFSLNTVGFICEWE